MAEKEYIERSALINKIFPIGLIDDGRYVIPAKAVKTAIDKAPTADVAPVVRCKDCCFYEIDVEYYDGGTKDICRLLTRQTYSDDFCSYGKRKETTP